MGKQDFISHEKWREVHESEVGAAADMDWAAGGGG